MKPVMYIRKVIEVAQVHSGWRRYFICGPGVDWEFLTVLLFFRWGFWDELWAFSQGTFKGHFWDAFPCPSSLRVVLWNAEGCPVPLSIAPQTPSLCTLLASAVKFADVSTDWGSEWPSVLWDLFPRPHILGPNWLTLKKWSTSSWCNIKCVKRRAARF